MTFGYRATIAGNVLPISSLGYRLNLIEDVVLMRVNVVIPNAVSALPVIEDNTEEYLVVDKRDGDTWSPFVHALMTDASIDYTIGGRNSSLGITAQQSFVAVPHAHLISTEPWIVYAKQADGVYTVRTLFRPEVMPGMWAHPGESPIYGMTMRDYLRYLSWDNVSDIQLVRLSMSANRQGENMQLFFRP